MSLLLCFTKLIFTSITRHVLCRPVRGKQISAAECKAVIEDRSTCRVSVRNMGYNSAT